jgi:predicted O-linked N-acetylglucosamine transferase (SPINDLY family)
MQKIIDQINNQEYSAAETSIIELLEKNKDNAFGWKSLGVCYQLMSRYDEALQAYKNNIKITREDYETYNNIGLIYFNKKLYMKALKNLYRSLKINKNNGDAHNNIGCTLVALGKVKESEIYFKTAITLNNNLTSAYFNLASTYKELGEITKSKMYANKCLENDKNYYLAINLLGVINEIEGNLIEAEDKYKKCIEINDKYSQSYSNLANIQKKYGNLTLAKRLYEKSISIDSEVAEYYNNYGNILKDEGDYFDAINLYKKALEINNNDMKIHSNLIFCLNYHTDLKDDGKKEVEKYSKIMRSNGKKNSRLIDNKKIRIGFVSADLYKHPVSYFLKTVLKNINKERYEIYTYYNNTIEDEETINIKKYVNNWVNINFKKDIEVVSLIEQDNIDILIDLSGHTAGNRLGVFTYKPAPIQITWLGYCATTGIKEIDYLIADECVIPRNEEKYFTEKILRMPDVYFCFSKPEFDIKVEQLPAIKNGFITFGCFNNASKITDDLIIVWSEILKSIENSKIILKSKQFNDDIYVEKIINIFEKNDVNKNKITFLKSSERNNYLRQYNLIDISLDTFPYPGATTTIESLWMGVPVVAIKGNSFLSRNGETILLNSGMENWISQDKNDYINKAIKYKNDIESLSVLRKELRTKLINSNIFNDLKYIKNYEILLEKIIQNNNINYQENL